LADISRHITSEKAPWDTSRRTTGIQTGAGQLLKGIAQLFIELSTQFFLQPLEYEVVRQRMSVLIAEIGMFNLRDKQACKCFNVLVHVGSFVGLPL
jgi:hypothetical protein